MISIKPSYCTRNFRRWDRGKQFVIWAADFKSCKSAERLLREFRALSVKNPNRVLGLIIRKDDKPRRWQAILWATERALAI